MQVSILNQYAQIMTGMLSPGKTSVRRQKTEARTNHSTASVVLQVPAESGLHVLLHVSYFFWFYFLNIQSCTCLITSLYISIYKKY